MRRSRWLALSLALGAACRPDFGASLSLVDSTRIIDVRSEPPEANPGDAVVLTPHAVSSAGNLTVPLAFSLCLAPKPATENDAVNASCLAPGGTEPVASGALATVTLPRDACRLFGPDLPPQMAGQPQLLPRAADATGGYYQPVRIDGAGPTVMALVRVRCNLAAASPDLAAAFAAQYTPNRNPRLGALTATVAGAPAALDAVPAGARVTFQVSWTPDSPESYPVLDPLAQTLSTHREAMSVSWFATDGAFLDERTGRAENDLALDTSNEWTAPASSGAVQLWIVLRDSRGGSDFAYYPLVVR